MRFLVSTKQFFKTMELCELLDCSLFVRYVNLKLKASLPEGEKFWVEVQSKSYITHSSIFFVQK